ncbi:uncharacterized protein LOC110711839 [Chenopodium quinoa]|uniref:uncharacterized protein LOC110711839 n=1 Tax=Chenopodium quinoa TaxID=63459 RepID=UPI000B793C3E|nr:uncharacterized protein LOC110711839 [Chenopodium quinoa]
MTENKLSDGREDWREGRFLSSPLKWLLISIYLPLKQLSEVEFICQNGQGCLFSLQSFLRSSIEGTSELSPPLKQLARLLLRLFLLYALVGLMLLPPLTLLKLRYIFFDDIFDFVVVVVVVVVWVIKLVN